MLALNQAVKIVAIAQNGRQAVEMTRKYQPEIAIIDINMPEIDGIAAISLMRQQNPDLYCIVISVEREEYIVDAAREAGASEYLVKPFTVDELNEAVERATPVVMGSRQRKRQLVYMANEYIKHRRINDEALEVFEQLAANPGSELRWTMSLGIIYMLRRDWGKLKALAERMEK